MLFLVSYDIQESAAVNGVDCVNADTHDQACDLVAASNSDACNITAMTKEEWGDDDGWDDMTQSLTVAPGQLVNVLYGS